MRILTLGLLCLALTRAQAQTAPEVPVTPLDGVVVKGKREHKPTLSELLGKVMRPVEQPLNHDLNQAGEGMRKMAEWVSDSDPTHRRPRDGFQGGDPPDPCGADLSQGCPAPR